MITDEDIKSIIYKEVCSDLEIIEVLTRYIYDLTNIVVIINRPTNIFHIKMMLDMFNYPVVQYYVKNLK